MVLFVIVAAVVVVAAAAAVVSIIWSILINIQSTKYFLHHKCDNTSVYLLVEKELQFD